MDTKLPWVMEIALDAMKAYELTNPSNVFMVMLSITSEY